MLLSRHFGKPQVKKFISYTNSTHIFIVYNANYTIFNNKVKGKNTNLESLVRNFYGVRVLRKQMNIFLISV